LADGGQLSVALSLALKTSLALYLGR